MPSLESSPPSTPSAKLTIAVIGASNDRSKFGNKSVRAYLQEGWDVYPVHPTEKTIEGLATYRSISDIPIAHLDRVSIYVPPAVGLRLLPEIAKKGCRELWLNPGAESDDIIDRATDLKLNVIVACSIVAVGANPNELK